MIWNESQSWVCFGFITLTYQTRTSQTEPFNPKSFQAEHFRPKSYFSFIGVSQSLPMTAYIKMIDTWMIFTMFYPFCVVTLYSVLQFLNARKQNITLKSEQDEGKIKKITGIINFLLDNGLPIIVLIFIMIFWILGINHTSSELNKSCWGINCALMNGCCFEIIKW